MDCPTCGNSTSVINSRIARGAMEGSVRRRRECSECAARFTTYELTETDLQVLRAFEKDLRTLQKVFDSLQTSRVRYVLDLPTTEPQPPLTHR